MFRFEFAFRSDEISDDIGSKRGSFEIQLFVFKKKINNMVLARCASPNYHLIIETCLCVDRIDAINCVHLKLLILRTKSGIYKHISQHLNLTI